MKRDHKVCLSPIEKTKETDKSSWLHWWELPPGGTEEPMTLAKMDSCLVKKIQDKILSKVEY